MSPENPLPILKVTVEIKRADGWGTTMETPNLIGAKPSSIAAANQQGPVAAVPVAIKAPTEKLIKELEAVVSELRDQLEKL